MSAAVQLVHRLLEDDGEDAKGYLMQHAPSWAEHVRAYLSKTDDKPYAFARASDATDDTISRAFLVDEDGQPAFAIYRDIDATREDAFNAAWEDLVVQPSVFSSSFLYTFIDFRRLAGMLAMDEPTRHLRTKREIIDYFEENYDDPASQMLTYAPLDGRQRETAAKAAADDNPLFFLGAANANANVHGKHITVPFDYLPATVREQFEADEPDEEP